VPTPPPQQQPIDPAVPAPIIQPLERGSGRYRCEAKCNIEETPAQMASTQVCAGNTGTRCPFTQNGFGRGSSPVEAYKNAKKAIDDAIPIGCYKRHCRGVRLDCKGMKG
jgi:hypothetical protein